MRLQTVRRRGRGRRHRTIHRVRPGYFGHRGRARNSGHRKLLRHPGPAGGLAGLAKQRKVTVVQGVGQFADPKQGEPIPVLLSSQMVEIYNASFAEARNLPRLDKRILPFIPPLPLTLPLAQPLTALLPEVGDFLAELARQAIAGATDELETGRLAAQAGRIYRREGAVTQADAELGVAQAIFTQLGAKLDLERLE